MTATSTWLYPADVWNFAAEAGVTATLEPMREKTLELFPSANSVSILLENDAEIDGLRWITFEVRIQPEAIPDYRTLRHRWYEKL